MSNQNKDEYWMTDVDAKAAAADAYDPYDKLNPEFLEKVKRVQAALSTQGYDVYIPRGSGYRTPAEQLEKFRQGVSRAKVGPHNYGAAVDLVPRDKLWNAPKEYWTALGDTAKKEGLTWGGTFKKIYDPAHLELANWRALRDQAAKPVVPSGVTPSRTLVTRPAVTPKPAVTTVTPPAKAVTAAVKPAVPAVKTSAFAPGIEDPKALGDPEQLTPGELVPYVVQEHQARRAGLHSDIRIGKGKMLSWATRKDIPTPGAKRIAVFQQPQHDESYARFQGTIKKGYGEGVVRTADFGKVLITHSDPRKIEFVVAHKKDAEKFTLIRIGNRAGKKPAWLMMNTTPTDAPQFTKEKYKVLPAKDIDKLFDPEYVMSAKIDGAAALLHLLKDKVEVMSIRPSERTGGPIVHTQRMRLGGARYEIPKELQNTLLRGEIYGVRNNKAIPPQELGGILNSSLEKSMGTQDKRGIQMRMALFGVPGMQGPQMLQRNVIQDALKFLPQGTFGEPPYATTLEEKQKMWKDITSGAHNITREGVVGFPTAGGVPTKVKPVQDYDVHISSVFPQVKGDTSLAGGFRYALKPGGPEVGEVGTGFTRAERQAMTADPSQYLGRIAKIQAQSQFPSGAYRAPVYIARHEDPVQKAAAMSAPLNAVNKIFGINSTLGRVADPSSFTQASTTSDVVGNINSGAGMLSKTLSGTSRVAPALAPAASGFKNTLGRTAGPAGAVIMGAQALETLYRDPNTGAYSNDMAGNVRANADNALANSTGRSTWGNAVAGFSNAPKAISSAAVGLADLGQTRNDRIEAQKNMAQQDEAIKQKRYEMARDKAYAGTTEDQRAARIDAFKATRSAPAQPMQPAQPVAPAPTAPAQPTQPAAPAPTAPAQPPQPTQPAAPLQKAAADLAAPLLAKSELMGSRGRAKHYGRPEPTDSDYDHIIFTDDPVEQQQHLSAMKQLAGKGWKSKEWPGGFMTVSNANRDISVYPTSKRQAILKAWKLMEEGKTKDEAWATVDQATEKAAGTSYPVDRVYNSRACPCGYTTDTYYDICPKCQAVTIEETKDPQTNGEHQKYVAKQAGKVIGRVTASKYVRKPNTVELTDLYVDPDFRKQGIARSLITHVRQAHKDAVLSLKPRSFADSVLAEDELRAVYTKMGFSAVPSKARTMILEPNYKSAAFKLGLELTSISSLKRG